MGGTGGERGWRRGAGGKDEGGLRVGREMLEGFLWMQGSGLVPIGY